VHHLLHLRLVGDSAGVESELLVRLRVMDDPQRGVELGPRRIALANDAETLSGVSGDGFARSETDAVDEDFKGLLLSAKACMAGPGSIRNHAPPSGTRLLGPPRYNHH
jgi:hypothetical protein